MCKYEYKLKDNPYSKISYAATIKKLYDNLNDYFYVRSPFRLFKREVPLKFLCMMYLDSEYMAAFIRGSFQGYEGIRQ